MGTPRSRYVCISVELWNTKNYSNEVTPSGVIWKGYFAAWPCAPRTRGSAAAAAAGTPSCPSAGRACCAACRSSRRSARRADSPDHLNTNRSHCTVCSTRSKHAKFSRRAVSSSALTIERDAVEVLGSRDLCRHLHAAADERLAEHVLHDDRELRVERQLGDHRNGVLKNENPHAH